MGAADEKNEPPETGNTGSRRGICAVKIAAFVLIFCLLLSMTGNVFQQTYGRDTGTDVSGIEGFYDLPEDTVQTIILGASIAGCGVNTPLLYEEYGICAYNLSVSWQPVMASYFWTKETYRLHSDTLTTVVLDVSTLRHTEELTQYYKASIDRMQLSDVKAEAVTAYSETLNDMITNLIPLFFYHDRWNGNLTELDITGFKYEPENILGYEFFYKRYLDSTSWNSMQIIDGVLNTDAESTAFGEDALNYLNKLVEFCDENDLELILIKTPHQGWTSSNHNELQEIADQYELTFLDFNYDPLLSEIEFNLASDTVDGAHANYYGAFKITAYLGEWLTENADVKDVRGDADYAFMEEYMEAYHSEVTDVIELKETTSLTDYLEKAMADADNEIFLLVQDTSAEELPEELREALCDLGLTELSELGFRSSYIGIIEDGTVIYEEADTFDQELYDALAEEAELLDEEEAEELMAQFTSLTYEGETDGVLFSLESGGLYTGNIASCVIEGSDYAQTARGMDDDELEDAGIDEDECAIGTRGLNVIVYNREQKEVIDSAVFDLIESDSTQSLDIEAQLADEQAAAADFDDLSDTLQNYILYNRRTELSALAATINLEAGDDGLLTYLENWMAEEHTAVFLSVKDEASASLSEEAREYLAQLGLTGLSEIEERDSYIGVILDGEVVYEEDDHGETQIEYSDIWYSVESGGYDSGNTSSIEINGTEYSAASRGINIVVYDTELGIVADTANFDTYAIEQTVPDGEDAQ